MLTHTAELARSFLVTWRQKASKARRLRLDAEQSLIERDDRLALAALTKWRDLAKERKLRAVEAEVADRHEDALMFAVWDKWKSKSKVSLCHYPPWFRLTIMICEETAMCDIHQTTHNAHGFPYLEASACHEAKGEIDE
jgi:hypothetical protein